MFKEKNLVLSGLDENSATNIVYEFIDQKRHDYLSSCTKKGENCIKCTAVDNFAKELLALCCRSKELNKRG
jgi:hypothetical protein